MPDCGSQEELTLRRLREGGFIVISKGYVGEYGNILFGSDSIDTSLAYMKSQVKPTGPEPGEVNGGLPSFPKKFGDILKPESTEQRDEPVGVSRHAGAGWENITRFSNSPLHAIQFKSGRIWDAVNGWRS